MKYIVDTHSLVWYFAKDSRLSNKVKQILQDAEQGRNEVIIPVIVLLEALVVAEKNKVEFDIVKLLDFVEASSGFLAADMSFTDVRELTGVGEGLDLHDRLIVLAAKNFRAPILSRDSEIKEIAQTIW